MDMMMANFRLLPSQRFHQAIMDNDIQLLKWLMSNKKIDDICNKDADENRWSSLMLAARYNHCDIFKYLLDLGHEEENISTDAMGNTIPMISAKYRHEDICLMYLEKYPQTISN
ncbi:Target of rapamycin complex 2 subunit avo2, partial [Coemansia sp. RSA 2618]